MSEVRSSCHGGLAGVVAAICLLLLLLLSARPLSAAHDQQDENRHLLPGADFSDPEKLVEMNEEWRSRPINRVDWANGADLAVTLDQHLYPALLPMIQQFARQHMVDIAVQEGTCGISAGRLIDRQADIGGFCCPAGESDRLPGLRYHTLGIAPLALLVASDHPLRQLTVAEVRAIFSGELRQVPVESRDGSARVAIEPIGRLHCKNRPGHWRLLLDHEDLFSPRLQEVGTIPEMIETVATTPGGIGYEASWMVERFDHSGEIRKLIIDGIHPDDTTALIEGRYPFYRTYQITTWEQTPAASPLARRLVAYLVDSAERIDKAYGIVPVDRLRKAKWRFRQDELVGAPHL